MVAAPEDDRAGPHGRSPEEDGDPGDAPVRIPITDSLDLHPFAPRETREVVESYLEAALEAGFEEVRLIHGRGTGTQREIVRSLLSRHPGVEEFADAPPGRGGWGATIVRLRRS